MGIDGKVAVTSDEDTDVAALCWILVEARMLIYAKSPPTAASSLSSEPCRRIIPAAELSSLLPPDMELIPD